MKKAQIILTLLFLVGLFFLPAGKAQFDDLNEITTSLDEIHIIGLEAHANKFVTLFYFQKGAKIIGGLSDQYVPKSVLATETVEVNSDGVALVPAKKITLGRKPLNAIRILVHRQDEVFLRKGRNLKSVPDARLETKEMLKRKEREFSYICGWDFAFISFKRFRQFKDEPILLDLRNGPYSHFGRNCSLRLKP
jgi:hypothetical protein